MIVLSSFRARTDAFERDQLIELLTVTNGGMMAACRLSGLHRSRLRDLVIRHGLSHMLHHGSTANLTQRGNAAWRALSDEVRT